MKYLMIIIMFSISATLYSQYDYPHIVKKIFTDKENYFFGETILIKIRTINTSSNPDTLIFIDGCATYPMIDGKDYLEIFDLGCTLGRLEVPILANDSLEWNYEYPHPFKPHYKMSIGKHFVYANFPYWTSNSDTAYFEVLDGVNSVTYSNNTNNFNLVQNYPNPFNPSTTINYYLPKRSYVNITVYDVLGTKVSTLVQAYKNEGNYKIQFDGVQLNSGVYYYVLDYGESRISKKMVLIK